MASIVVHQVKEGSGIVQVDAGLESPACDGLDAELGAALRRGLLAQRGPKCLLNERGHRATLLESRKADMVVEVIQ